MFPRAYIIGLLCSARIAYGTSDSPYNAFKPYTIKAPNISATFIPYGARLTSLLVPDRNGETQDVVLGYDFPEQYLNDTETVHTYYGAVVGRYANRIKNGTFTVDGIKHHVSLNGPHDLYTLHGGIVGYDQRSWNVTSSTRSSVTFSLYDTGFEGFPGDVITNATYTVMTGADGLPQLTTELTSISLTEKTTIMLTNHIYWNLNTFLAPTIEDDTWLQLPLSHRLVGVDNIEVPTGKLFDVTTSYGGSADFLKGKLIGADINKTSGLCGQNCLGYDDCMIVDRPPKYQPDALVPVVRMNSKLTGISMELMSDQKAVQIYTCNGVGPFPVKPSQIKRNKAKGHAGVDFVQSHGCIAIEPQGWIDGINNPQWGQRPFQIFGPEDGPARNLAVYKFGTIP